MELEGHVDFSVPNSPIRSLSIIVLQLMVSHGSPQVSLVSDLAHFYSLSTFTTITRIRADGRCIEMNKITILRLFPSSKNSSSEFYEGCLGRSVW